MSLRNIHNHLISKEAAARGIRCELLVPEMEDIMVLTRDDSTIYINKTRSHKLSSIAGVLSKNKAASNILLRAHGIPIPTFMLASEMNSSAIHFLSTHHTLVVKPCDADRSVGVYMHIQTEDSLRKAIDQTTVISSHAMLQQQVKGNDYRLLVIDRKLEGALWNRWPSVTGDGTTSILELIRQENKRRKQIQDPASRHILTEPIPVDDRTLLSLSVQNLLPSYIPYTGERVTVNFCGNAWAGAEPVDVTDKVHPDNQHLAIQVADSLGLDVAGIDIRSHDITQSWKKGGLYIIEANILPSMFEHVFPMEGKSRNVIGAYLDYLFK